MVGQQGATHYGGIVLKGYPVSTLTLQDSILAYNSGYSLFASGYENNPPTIRVLSSTLYNPASAAQHNLRAPGAGLWTLEPGFLRYNEAGLPIDLHLAHTSPLVNVGTDDELDADGSPPDLGLYGGAAGAQWDIDVDGLPEYFWPGTWSEAPDGIRNTLFDQDDLTSFLSE